MTARDMEAQKSLFVINESMQESLLKSRKRVRSQRMEIVKEIEKTRATNVELRQRTHDIIAQTLSWHLDLLGRTIQAVDSEAKNWNSPRDPTDFLDPWLHALTELDVLTVVHAS
jgi:hypothetical protein